MKVKKAVSGGGPVSMRCTAARPGLEGVRPAVEFSVYASAMLLAGAIYSMQLQPAPGTTTTRVFCRCLHSLVVTPNVGDSLLQYVFSQLRIHRCRGIVRLPFVSKVNGNSFPPAFESTTSAPVVPRIARTGRHSILARCLRASAARSK